METFFLWAAWIISFVAFLMMSRKMLRYKRAYEKTQEGTTIKVALRGKLANYLADVVVMPDGTILAPEKEGDRMYYQVAFTYTDTPGAPPWWPSTRSADEIMMLGVIYRRFPTPSFDRTGQC